MTGPVIEARGISQRFRRGAELLTVLDGLDVDVAPGEVVAVTGPSLSGKTTVVELLAGWRRADQGSIRWHGAADAPPWGELTVVPQAFALLEELSVEENILLSRRVAGRDLADDEAHLDQLLSALGLGRLRHRGAFEISVGERQRTMVVRALVGRPVIVIADEPVAHQDQYHAEAVLGLLRAAADEDGAAVVVATRQPEVAAVADREIELASPVLVAESP